MTLSKFVCKNCGKEFHAYYQTGHKARIYCGKKCQHIGMKNFRHTEECKKYISDIKRKLRLSKEKLSSLYWNESKTCSDIAREYNVSNPTVARRMRELKIPKRKLSQTMKGKHNSPKTEFKKGCVSYNKGKKLHYDVWQKGKPNLTFIKLNKDPEFQKKRLKGLCKKPTKPERIVIEIIKKHRLSFDYVGDGSFIIDNLNPDFISNKKEIIEVFSRFWHETYKNVDWKRTEKGRKKIFAQQGYKTLILWDDELKNSSEQEILNKIKNFQEKK